MGPLVGVSSFLRHSGCDFIERDVFIKPFIDHWIQLYKIKGILIYEGGIQLVYISFVVPRVANISSPFNTNEIKPMQSLRLRWWGPKICSHTLNTPSSLDIVN